MMKCKKCENPGTVVLRRKDNYCENCLVTSIMHKFRACIGKNRAISPNEKVLVCLSGGTSSTVLLDMIHYGISLNNHKKLRMEPVFLHFIDSNNRETEEITSAVINQCKQYNSKVYMIHMSDYIQKHTNLPEAYIVPAAACETEFQAMLSSMPTTVKNDFIRNIRRNLSLRIAQQLQCNSIFTAETTATLAINLLSSLSVGRGAQVQDDVSFCDARDERVQILRPMKDISKEELQYYIKIKKLHPADSHVSKEDSLQSVIGMFVTELQDSFQGTISTICKTADKIGTHNDDSMNLKCVLCKCDLRVKSTKLTALEATNFSRIVSLEKPGTIDGSNIELENPSDEQSARKPMFSFINEHLCYGCSRNYLEMNHSKLPCYIQEMLQS